MGNVKKSDDRGFTLIELIVTIVILGLVLSIGGYSIIKVMNSAKKSDYDLLIENIKAAAEVYYQECKYSNISGISCNSSDDTYNITLGKLVEYGYLKGNASNEDTDLGIVNPKDNKDISRCQITVKYNSDSRKVVISDVGATGSCPTKY